jgi:peptidoglycan/LPS O-acetylase OafA/YrhL
VPPLVAMLIGYLLYLPGIGYMSHTWSLSVEEQFYLIWPVTLMMLFRLLGLSWRTIGA